MKYNVGGIDRAARLILGVILLLVGLLAPVTMIWRIVLLVIAAIALITATVRFCPANAILGINTAENKYQK
ncbi:DUF2892 domain-containing protein [Sideroxydans sp. CL21]|uniref:YgaP family membrane protein n=1 Tax=Sideroxydans sp. CL21 TaxID=2600596 RepID=UPI0012A829B3|nr:DUF2892 domain-containing protein [Sideroxydans sp. CL21]VVC84007.1 hypothetical protein [Sideroxydans sp. CL21]